MADPFVHIELMATDVGQAKTFYGKLSEMTICRAGGCLFSAEAGC